jgi:hypothetical protein
MPGDDQTLRSLFFSEGAPRNLSIKETLTDLPEAMVEGVSSEVMENLQGVLDVSLVDVVLEGWGKYKELLQYRDRTRYPPDQTILLPLAHHEIHSIHKPYVDVLLGDRPIGRVTFTVDLRLTFDGVVLVIRDGSIWEVKAGTCEGRGLLSCGAIELADRRIVKFDLPGRVKLPDGFPIPGDARTGPERDAGQGKATRDGRDIVAGAAFSHAPVYRLGRSRDNDFVIDDRTVSRYHALLSVAADGDLHLTDLGSTGGTFVREGGGWKRVTDRDVAAGNELRFGDYEIGVGPLLAALARSEERRAG